MKILLPVCVLSAVTSALLAINVLAFDKSPVEMNGSFWNQMSPSEKTGFLSGMIYGQLRTYDLVRITIDDRNAFQSQPVRNFWQSYLALSGGNLAETQKTLDTFYSQPRNAAVCMDSAVPMAHAKATGKGLPSAVNTGLEVAEQGFGCE